MKCTCYDCAHCASRDVFMGFCEKKQESVVLDHEIECGAFAARAKCKNCAFFQETEAYFGTCSSDGAPVPAYPDLFGCKNHKPVE